MYRNSIELHVTPVEHLCTSKTPWTIYRLLSLSYWASIETLSKSIPLDRLSNVSWLLCKSMLHLLNAYRTSIENAIELHDTSVEHLNDILSTSMEQNIKYPSSAPCTIKILSKSMEHLSNVYRTHTSFNSQSTFKTICRLCHSTSNLTSVYTI